MQIYGIGLVQCWVFCREVFPAGAYNKCGEEATMSYEANIRWSNVISKGARDGSKGIPGVHQSGGTLQMKEFSVPSIDFVIMASEKGVPLNFGACQFGVTSGWEFGRCAFAMRCVA